MSQPSSKALGKRRATLADPLSNPARPCVRATLVASRYSAGFGYNTTLKSHHGCVNALAFSRGNGQWLASGGDDKRVHLWNTYGEMTTAQPRATYKGARSNIFSIAFTADGTKMLSGGNDDMVLLFDLETSAASTSSSSAASRAPVDLWRHDAPVKSVCTHPSNPHLFLSASDDGSIRSFDLRTDLGVVATLQEASEFNDVAYSPVVENLFVTADSEGRVLLHDARVAFGDGALLASKVRVRQYATSLRLRSPDATSLSGRRFNFDSSSIVFDPSGRLFCSTISRYFPTLFDVSEEHPVATFGSAREGDLGYKNACTIKHGDFGGSQDSLYYAAGSDDFNAYVWAVPALEVLKARRQDPLSSIEIKPENPPIAFDFRLDPDIEEPLRQSHPLVPEHISKPSCVLTGHRSIVNTALFHPSLPLIFTSGVEKVILVHSPSPFANLKDQVPFIPRQRNPNAPPNDDLRGSEEEDLGCLEYFDSLLARDEVRWNSFLDGNAPSGSDDESDGSEDNVGLHALVGDSDDSDAELDGDQGHALEADDRIDDGWETQDSDSGVDDADLVALGAAPEDLA